MSKMTCPNCGEQTLTYRQDSMLKRDIDSKGNVSNRASVAVLDDSAVECDTCHEDSETNSELRKVLDKIHSKNTTITSVKDIL